MDLWDVLSIDKVVKLGCFRGDYGAWLRYFYFICKNKRWGLLPGNASLYMIWYHVFSSYGFLYWLQWNVKCWVSFSTMVAHWNKKRIYFMLCIDSSYNSTLVSVRQLRIKLLGLSGEVFLFFFLKDGEGDGERKTYSQPQTWNLMTIRMCMHK